ncbi:MAG: hypothetical protein QOI55_166 [Actinomycetota bacterium]|jgi:hypothetical protein|nr:hypothetical protein [Actinomycetota bacterium]
MSSPRAISSLFCRAVAPVCVVALAACSSGGSKPAANNSKPSAQKITVPGAHVELRLASIDVQSAGSSTALDDKTKLAVMTQARQYVEEAIVRPLMTGNKVKHSYTQMFGPALTSAVTRNPDRGALTDEAVGKVTGDLTAPSTPVAMHALIDTNGSMQYIATNFTLRLHSKLGAAALTIRRTTELTFERTPKGKWLVGAYRVIATRKTGAASAPSTSKATSKTTEKP